MKRRSFIKAGGLAGLMAGIRVAPHNWDNYDFGPAPAITDRLGQGPFSAYGPDATAPGAEVVMATTPSRLAVPNPGMGMVTYICDEAGPPKVEGESLETSIENLATPLESLATPLESLATPIESLATSIESLATPLESLATPIEKLATSIESLAKFPLGDKLYLRVDWRDIQSRPGRLDFPDHWKICFDMARKYNKKVGLRIQMMSPVIEPQSLPDFLAGKVPFVELGTTDEIGIPGKVHMAPRYDHPEFMSAFKELDDLLSDLYNGHDLVEFVDTYMYGFWGEGHTWPFEGNPFPDYLTAERTSIALFEHQARNWDKTPLLTNTQPDYSNVGNSEVLDRTIRSFNWLRTDTIFIENEQIEALSNRPPWTGALVENGISFGGPETLRMKEGISRSENIIRHAKDVSPHYFSLWNWHQISARHLEDSYRQFKEPLDELAVSIGYRVRPSWIWVYEKESYPTLILGLVNDGLAGVPGALRIYVKNSRGEVLSGGSLDPGYPLPGKVRQAEFTLPAGTAWEGLRIFAEIEIKNKRHPVRWACHQDLNDDGSLTLRRNI